MVNVLFDSNILIDFLNGVKAAEDELSLYNDKAVSVITWIEVMSGAPDDPAARLFPSENCDKAMTQS